VEKCCRTGMPRMTVWRLRIAWRITSYTHIHTHTHSHTHTHTHSLTLRICNTFCISSVTMVARTRLNVTLHVRCLSYTALTFKNRASYIQDGRTATLQMSHFIYIFSTNISTEYFNHAARSPFFSSKCRLFHNATFFWFLSYSHFTYRVC
jgi:hypothetical protein